MNCPECKQPQAKTLSTRHTDDFTISRLRKCCLCGHQWSSLEISLDKHAGHYTKGISDHYMPHWHIQWNYIDAIKRALAHV